MMSTVDGPGSEAWWARLGAALRGAWAPRPRPGGVQVRCEADWSWDLALDDYDLWCVMDGIGRARINGGQDITVTAGCTLLLRPGDVVEARHDPRNPLTVSSQHYQLGAPTGAPLPAELLPPRVVRLDDLPEVRRQLDGLARIGRRAGPDGAVRATAGLTALLLEVHAQAARGSGALPALLDGRVRDVVEWLARHPSRRLALDEAAESAGLSADGFSRLFRRETGRSFRAFQVEVRIDRACELLAESGMTVGQVAAALGYGDAHLFARQFRARTGTAPSAAAHGRRRSG